ncbi:Oidioi.mRNA.OKI2018_I69.PAR.g8623.t1.cds [Oikopleura dioica]|uniref:Fucosyltransferase n=1 Tax=Oikopleura dioica TaxID=34765 RepID=A0ABN7RMP6_OIKDI|nr:Oidioi.mRNA.OKI2018_I69.PAR.g8623.t1.cds [Oikopleura dioica]
MTGEQMHEKLIQRLSPSERKKWMGKIWGTKMRPQGNREEKVVILGWYENRLIPNQLTRIPSKPFQNYGRELCGECFITNDRDMYETADAVIINNGPLLSFQKAEDERLRKKDPAKRGRSQDEQLKPPSLETRNSSQYWVFVNYESGIKNIDSQQNLQSFTQEFDSSFNITYSYKRDSDIVRGYGSIQKTMRMYFDEVSGKELLSNEQMMEKILKLKNHEKEGLKDFHTEAGLKLHGEGACFENQTKRSFGNMAKSLKYNSDSEDTVIQHMKFYLSFENAYHCTDYISEKFWRNALGALAVPVVFGPHYDDVKQIAPPNSFIHAEQFEEAADLVFYLDYLDKNDNAYMEYHDWRSLRPERIKPLHESHFTLSRDEYDYCRICRLIRAKRAAKINRWYQSVMRFWRFDVHRGCKQDAKYPEYIEKIKKNLVEVPAH